METIENEFLIAQINPMGAELTRLIDKQTGVDYIWDGNPAVWPKHAPNLFPAIGRSMNEHYLINGERYQMPQHGVAFFHEFQVNKLAANVLKLTLIADSQTRQYYPFDFTFSIQFELIDRRLRMIDTVINPNDVALSFAVGTHPAWRLPMVAGERFEDYEVIFDREPAQLTYHEFMFDHGAPLRTGAIKSLNQYDGQRLKLTRSLFKDGLIVFDEKNRLSEITLRSTVSEHAITVRFPDFPQFCLWTQADKQAEFLCLEPFYGVSDQFGREMELMEKVGNRHLAAKQMETFVVDYDIKTVVQGIDEENKR